ncbi:hypothetical protein [Flavobacterium sp. HSC-61S13]|uniref:hypothetical protein n=1 Tax=Flavobacterium sp. HSC-61S13 TaxID=2910963 RepID=UPI00209FF392|nr:hypothetical protein [Flavobacterium sp. HSC-61S13]MCP1994308.1 hypothetical protein [Flavobacterium sp. HSC-61S13]
MEKYLQPIVDFLDSHHWSDDEAEFALIQYDIVDVMEQNQIGVESVQPILELMEKHPLVEFGSPGPLTHFIEKFYQENSRFYEDLLLQSVLKQPTVHTVWLLNRIINGVKTENSLELIQVLKSISVNTAIHQEIRLVAVNFLEYQSKNEA